MTTGNATKLFATTAVTNLSTRSIITVTNSSTRSIISEQQQMDAMTSGKTIATVFIVLLIITCLVGNSLMCLMFHRYRRLRIISNYFVISLAVSDLLVGLVAMPFWISMELTGWENLPPSIDIRAMQTAWQCVDIFCCTSSIVNLSAVSLERFFGVYKPLRHRRVMTSSNTGWLIVACWLYSLVLTLLKLAAAALKKNYIILIFVFGFLLPLLLVCGSYTGIYFTARRRRERTHSWSKADDATVTRSLLTVTVVFAACWLPFFTYVLLFSYCEPCHFLNNKDYGVAIKWLHYSNSALNPVIYGLLNMNFRTAFKNYVRHLMAMKRKRGESEYLKTAFPYPKRLFKEQYASNNYSDLNDLPPADNQTFLGTLPLSNAAEYDHIRLTDKMPHIKNLIPRPRALPNERISVQSEYLLPEVSNKKRKENDYVLDRSDWSIKADHSIKDDDSVKDGDLPETMLIERNFHERLSISPESSL